MASSGSPSADTNFKVGDDVTELTRAAWARSRSRTREAEAKVRALLAERAQWRPIASAPTDGTPVWLVEDGKPLGLLIPHQFVGYWKADRRYEEGGFWQAVDCDCVGDPTHFRPLPDPPAAVGEERP